jgi:hypothetical protein
MRIGTVPAACPLAKSFLINGLAFRGRHLEQRVSTMSPQLGTVPEDFSSQIGLSIAAGLSFMYQLGPDAFSTTPEGTPRVRWQWRTPPCYHGHVNYHGHVTTVADLGS